MQRQLADGWLYGGIPQCRTYPRVDCRNTHLHRSVHLLHRYLWVFVGLWSWLAPLWNPRGHSWICRSAAVGTSSAASALLLLALAIIAVVKSRKDIAQLPDIRMRSALDPRPLKRLRAKIRLRGKVTGALFRPPRLCRYGGKSAAVFPWMLPLGSFTTDAFSASADQCPPFYDRLSPHTPENVYLGRVCSIPRS
jgi:hypothetical protein